MAGINYFFFDVDGTLAHEFEDSEDDEKRFANVGNGFYVSKDNIAALETLRGKGVKTGFATSRRHATAQPIAEKIPHDMALIDHGAVIYIDGLVDREWFEEMKPLIGDPFRMERSGLLWDYAKELKAQRYHVDDAGKTGSFHVTGNPAELEELISRSHPSGISIVRNGRMVDFFPERMGRKNAILHVLRKQGFELGSERIAYAGNDYPDIPALQEFFPLTLSGAVPEVCNMVWERGGYKSNNRRHAGTADLISRVAELI